MVYRYFWIKMIFLILMLTVASVVQGRPSHLTPLLQFSDDGRSFSYSFQTPALFHSQQVVQPVVRSQLIQEALPASKSVIIGPAVSYGVVPLAKYVEPANIQVSNDGFVLDTPEVAQAKAAHLAQVAQESARAATSLAEAEDDGSQDDDTVEVASLPVIKTSQPVIPANIQVSSDGFVLDTEEVAQAKAEHAAAFNALAKAAAAAPDDSVEQNKVTSFSFSQPINVVAPAYQAYQISQPVQTAKSFEIADIRLSSDGHVLDTPEVAHAKAEHIAKYNEAAAIAAASPDNGEYNDNTNTNSVVVNPIAIAQPVHVYSAAPIVRTIPFPITTFGNQFVSNGAIGYTAYGFRSHPKIDDPPANIQVSADGFVQDTPEVASAKAAHLAKLAEAQASVSTDESSFGESGSAITYSVPLVQPKWTGPEADIQVGPDGFVIDTPEVQQARAEHLATRSKALAEADTEWSGASSRYATSQSVHDTAEVSAARASHFQTYAEELARHSASHTKSYGQLVYNVPFVRSNYENYAAPLKFLSFRYAPVAHVALTPNGQYLLDTPEVAAAKAEHFAAHAKALHQ